MAADVPKIVLVPHERSHPFVRRECVVNEALKVGRSVDRRRISQNNLIFDCRVLSRNHALIWFENGKFYIKDTKSSNGTFVNENRLSPSSEESGPMELRSRDIVQFGVNVNVEKKVTHGCIIANIRLYVNDVEVPGVEPPVHQVLQIVQSALIREQELENKLACMQDVLNAARQLASESMIAIVKEDELMSRLEMLENQLQVYSKNSGDDELKKQLVQAFEEKHKHELTSKDSLRTLLQEKLECISKLNQLQRDYDKAEQECQRFRTLYDAAKQEHSQECGRLSDQLKSAEHERKTLEEKLAQEKQSLSAELEGVQSEVEHKKKQLNDLKVRYGEAQEELVQLKIDMAVAKKRRDAGLASVSTLDSLEFGSEGGGVESFTEIPEDSLPQHPVTEPEGDAGVLQRAGEEGKRPSPLNRQETLIQVPPSPPAAAADPPTGQEAVERLEDKLRQSEETVWKLKSRLMSALRPTEVASGELQRRGGRGLESGEDPVVIIAKQMSETAIAKSQVEILQSALLDAEQRIKELEGALQAEGGRSCELERSLTGLRGVVEQCQREVRAREASVGELQAKLKAGQQRIAALQEEMKRCECEASELREGKEKLQKELVASRSHMQNNQLKAENASLSSQVASLQQQLERLRRSGDRQHGATLPPAHQTYPATPTSEVAPPPVLVADDEAQRVKVLTFVALVSIGVALASWLT